MAESSVEIDPNSYEAEQSKLENLLKSILYDADNDSAILQELFALFSNDEIKNVCFVITTLQKYFCNENDFAEVLSDNLLKNVEIESSNLLPFFESFCRFNALISHLAEKQIFIKIKDLMQSDIIHYLINENLIHKCDFFKILNVEQDFVLNIRQFYNFNFRKQQFLYYLVLSNVYNSIVLKTSQDLEIKELMHHIDDIKLYNKLLSDIFKLFFLRNSHLSRSSKQNSLNDLNSIMKPETEPYSKICNKNKFICTNSELRDILENLRQSIVNTNFCKSYEDDTLETEKLMKYRKHINETVYKLEILEKLKSFSKSVTSLEDLASIIQCHHTNINANSSDDDCLHMTEFSIRRKSKLKKRSSLGDSDKLLSNETLASTKFTQKQYLIPMLLCDFTTIAKYVLVFGNIEDAKNIIQVHKINDTVLNNQLMIMDKMKIYAKKMESVLQTIRHEQLDNLHSKSVVARIRNVAAIGFEVSSVINIIEQFISEVKVQPLPNHNRELLTKLLKNDTLLYLEQYEAKNLKLVTAMDLISNLDLENEICKNVINVMNRIGSLSDVSLHGKIGYFTFLNVISESMHIYRSISPNNENTTLKNFLLNTFSYDTTKIQNEVNNIIKFNEINQKDTKLICKIEDLKEMEKYFEKFDTKINYFSRMTKYLQNFIDFIKIRDKNCECDINEILKMSPHEIIEDIIFNHNVSFLELEKSTFLLNLHLVHVITELLYPEFFKMETKCKTNKPNQIDNITHLSILKYISLRSNFLGKLLYHLSFETVAVNDSVEQMNMKCLNKMIKLDVVINLSALTNKNLLTTALLMEYTNGKDLNLFSNTYLKYSVYNQLRENKSSDFVMLRSDCAKKLIHDNINYITLLESVCSLKERCILLIEKFPEVTDYVLLKRLINNILFHKDIKELDNTFIELITFIETEIEMYSEISVALNLINWKEAYDLGKMHPTNIFMLLIQHEEFELLKKWGKMTGIYTNVKNEQFTNINLKELMKNDEQLINLLDIIEKFPMNYVKLLIDNKLNHKINNMNSFLIIIKCFTNNSNENIINYKISLIILGIMKNNNLQVDWIMLDKPLLLIEQLIMNSEFQLLSKVLSEIDNQVSQESCKYCVQKIGDKNFFVSQYSGSHGTNLELGTNSDFILFNFNLHKKDHFLTSSCIDLLLRVYASKALDFQISNKSQISYKNISLSTDGFSIDSLAAIFKMPKIPPTKNEWIKDEDASICQSCRYTVFTMLIRRHHCRRCGRVVCYACSKYRMKIPEMYQDVQVRICFDCVKETIIQDDRTNKTPYRIENIEKYDARNSGNLLKWELNGNLTHDKMLREQFCYEHACDVALCLTILSHHKNKEKCIGLLLYHCKKLEMLLALNNPEVNFDSIAKILSCLSLAAKIRGGPSECDSIREHADIIKSFGKNGCENLMIPDSFNKNNIKKLIYNLVDAEKWSLALDISFKRGISKSDVLAAHGLSLLKAGCFELARSKFMYCMKSACSFTDGAIIFEAIMSTSNLNKYSLEAVRRPKRSPSLLSEIIRVIESTSNIVLLSGKENGTNSLQNSTMSICSGQSTSRQSNTNLNEIAFIVLNTLSSLKTLSNCINFNEHGKHLLNLKSKIFNECFSYLITYGSHADIISFLIRHEQIKAALRYFVLQHFKSEYFISNIFLHFLRVGEVTTLVENMLDLEEYLLIWNNIFTTICRYLETKGLYNCLYQMQVLLKDPIRASMTCVKFYLKNCTTFKQFNENLFHLDNAQKHLEAEMELCQNWENINFDNATNKVVEAPFAMQLDYKSLSTHLNTISLQKEVTKFLAKSEEQNSSTINQLKKMQLNSNHKNLPSLFGSIEEKIDTTAFILLCGRNLEEGFGLNFRIIQEFKLTPIKVYLNVTRFLAQNNRLEEILKLCNCIVENNDIEESAKEVDEIVLEAIKCYKKVPDINVKFKRLLKLVKNIETQISCYVHSDQLETACGLAIQHNQFDQIKKILNKAKELKRFDLENVCEKQLKKINSM